MNLVLDPLSLETPIGDRRRFPWARVHERPRKVGQWANFFAADAFTPFVGQHRYEPLNSPFRSTSL